MRKYGIVLIVMLAFNSTSAQAGLLSKLKKAFGSNATEQAMEAYRTETFKKLVKVKEEALKKANQASRKEASAKDKCKSLLELGTSYLAAGNKELTAFTKKRQKVNDDSTELDGVVSNLLLADAVLTAYDEPEFDCDGVNVGSPTAVMKDYASIGEGNSLLAANILRWVN